MLLLLQTAPLRKRLKTSDLMSYSYIKYEDEDLFFLAWFLYLSRYYG